MTCGDLKFGNRWAALQTPSNLATKRRECYFYTFPGQPGGSVRGTSRPNFGCLEQWRLGVQVLCKAIEDCLGLGPIRRGPLVNLDILYV